LNRYQVEVRVTPRRGLLDPQGNAVHNALQSLQFGDVGEVRVGRLIRLDVGAESASQARERVEAMCRQLLANPVTEDFEIRLEDGT
jgi:phosphoribosylformylglycinamidine synthase PurS subunit